MWEIEKPRFACAMLAALGACAYAPGSVDPDVSDAAAEVTGTDHRTDTLIVMTRNEYLGADLEPLLRAPDAATFNRETIAALDQIAANRFPERALSLALEIARQQPDAVGFQEVYDFTLDGANGPPPYRDQLSDTLRALALLGQHYVVAAQVQELATQVPVDFNGDGVADAMVGVLDRDVILVRRGLAFTPVPFSATCARPSLDGGPGCNYQVIAHAHTPAGEIALERGFVGVDLAVRGHAYRFVDTHLELADIDPSNPLSAAIQAAQAQELIGVLAATSPANRTLIVVGDFNSSPEQQVTVVGGVTIAPPYLQMAEAGFTDTWLVDPRVRSGFTAYQAPDLRNRRSLLSTRIDLIWSREPPVAARVDRVGAQQSSRTLFTHLWPSDHAGVVARLRFR
jgi:endonuclease/exonuclease/phosphatase family metal-dependent hydrolase